MDASSPARSGGAVKNHHATAAPLTGSNQSPSAPWASISPKTTTPTTAHGPPVVQPHDVNAPRPAANSTVWDRWRCLPVTFSSREPFVSA